MKLLNGIRSIISAFVVAGLGIFFSGRGVVEVRNYINNSEPLQMECETFDPAKLERNWVRLVNCSADVGGALALYELKKPGKYTELYIPVFRPSQLETEDAEELEKARAKIAAYTKDSAMLKLWTDYQTLVESGNEAAVEEFEEKHIEQLMLSTVEGTIRGGVFGSKSEDKLAIAESDVFEKDLVIMDLGYRPSLSNAFVNLALALGAFGFLGIRVFRRR